MFEVDLITTFWASNKLRKLIYWETAGKHCTSSCFAKTYEKFDGKQSMKKQEFDISYSEEFVYCVINLHLNTLSHVDS